MIDDYFKPVRLPQSFNHQLLKHSSEALPNLLEANRQLEEEINKCNRSQKALLATKIRLKQLISCSPAVIYSRQPSDNFPITFISESITQFGYEPQQFLEEGFWEKCLHPDESLQVFAQLLDLVRQDYQTCEYHFQDRQGNYRWIQDRRRLIRDERRNPLEIIGSWQDITENKRIEYALFQEKELAQVTLQSIGDGVITTDANGRIEYLNPIAEVMTGWTTTQAKGVLLDEVFQVIDETTRQSITNSVEEVLREGQTIERIDPHLLMARNHQEYAIAHSAAPIRNREGQILGVVLVFRDVTKPRNLALQLSWQANHDALTELVNRRKFEELLEEAIKTAKEQGKQHILCYLDLDQFKVVNDNGGHVAGDELLRQLAVVLKNHVRSADTVARLGGDEFGILLYQCPLEAGKNIADKIRKSVQDFRFVWQGHVFRIGVSIGLVSIDASTSNLNSLLSAADAACYAAKNRGRNRVHLYQTDDCELTQQHEERHWVSRIIKALEEDRYCLYLQPIVPVVKLPELQGEHFELLIRMIDEDGEIIPPMAFIPAAERYGLMSRLDRWVVNTFFTHYHQITNVDRGHYTINLSGMSLDDEQFLQFLKEQFILYQIPPQSICFEITETATIANLNKAVYFITELKQLGCYFALDDFGSGMSSFAYLKNLPVDYLKIDGYFIKNILTNPIDTAMVECINRIGHVIGIQTIAEFVENRDILDKLQEIGVDYAQGYSIAKPYPLL